MAGNGENDVVRNNEGNEIMNEAENEVEKSLKFYSLPSLNGAASCIIPPLITAGKFELRTGIITMLQQCCQFHGLSLEDPALHISNFLEICDTFKYEGVTPDAVRLRLFSFTLKDKAKEWLNRLPAGSITTWDQLATKFLMKFFPPAKTASLRREISGFTQRDAETLREAWERYTDLLKKCPHHGDELWRQIENFYNGLNRETVEHLDACSGGCFNNKSPEEAKALLDELTENEDHYPGTRGRRKIPAGVHQVDPITALTAQVEALTRTITNMKANSISCELCAGPHHTIECQVGNQQVDQAHFVSNYNQQGRFGQGQLLGNTYNPNNRNHPNFSWSQGNHVQQPQQFIGGHGSSNQQFARQQPPPGFSQPQEKKVNFDEFMMKYITKTDDDIAVIKASIINMEKAIIGLQAKQGDLPSDTEKNPAHERVQAISLRSGKKLLDIVQTPSEEEKDEGTLPSDQENEKKIKAPTIQEK